MPPKKDVLQQSIAYLIQEKEVLFEQLQYAYEMSKDISTPDNQELLLLRCSDIDELRKRFEKVVFKIFETQLESNPDAAIHNQELKGFDDIYYKIKLVANKLKNTTVNSVKVETQTINQSRPRLPKLELFTFDGDIENFTTFYETFCSLVHSQPYIPNIDKFHYLLSCTKGSALNIVKSLPITACNYDLVWKSLLDKYQDNRMLLGRYMEKMLCFTPISKESSTQLNTFMETFEHSYKAIQALNINNLNSYVMCHIALRALDSQTRKLFEQSLDQKSVPTFDDLITFVHNHIKVLDHSVSYTNNSSSVNLQQNKRQPFNKTDKTRSFTHASSSQNTFSCWHCNGDHMIFRCEKFRELSTDKRIDRVNVLKLCRNCLKPNHNMNECKSQFKCIVCQKSHHVLLHIDNKKSDFSSRHSDTSAPNVKVSSSQTSLSAPGPSVSCVSNSRHAASVHTQASTVILGTAVVHVLDQTNSYQPCRVLIDSGAQTNFISIDCLQRLGLSTRKCCFDIFGLAGEGVKNNGMTSFTMKPRHSNEPYFNIDAVVLTKLTGDLPTVQLPQSVIDEYRNLILADPQFYNRSKIDIILAGDVFPYIYDGKKLNFGSNIPVALSSIFGYVITGRLCQSMNHDLHVTTSTTSLHAVTFTVEDSLLNDSLKRFWEVESLPCEVQHLNPQDVLAEKIFIENYYRDETGRYVSPILLKPNHEPLGDSYNIAFKRLTQLERRLDKSPDLKKAYSDFMKEYESLGHMELYQGTEPSKYFIPHHCVLRPTSTTTPLRVVYNGSAPTTNGLSLNDILLTGQKLYQDIFKILSRFRLYDVCFTADVSKMYRCVEIIPSERKYQHILWRESSSEPVRIFELKTNTYGLRSAPFVAVRTLHQLAHDNPQSSASSLLMQGFYVDDVLWSCRSIDEACTLQDELTSLLKQGGFDLRKWASNQSELLTRMKTEQVTSINFQDDTLSSSIKVLGLTWLPSCDCFSFNYNLTDPLSTKRSVLKLLASIFDPVGFISPCTFVAKCIMQDLWKLSLGWDDYLPTELKEKWHKFFSALPCLSELRIERHLFLIKFNKIQLVAFCDASSLGYAACIYVRSTDNAGNIKVRLLTSKSKVAPMKPLMSIPRLELMAAVLLSKLVRFVVNNIKELDCSIIALSDSSVVLSWLQTPSYKLKTFIANRVSQITDIMQPNCWYHVSSEDNAADICSRGSLPDQFMKFAPEWIHGPSWLYQERDLWPIKSHYVIDENKVPELKSNYDTFCFTVIDNGDRKYKNNVEELIFNKISSFNKLQRFIAWYLRYKNYLKSKQLVTGPLTTLELSEAHDSIIRIIQTNHFDSELTMLSKKGYIVPMRKLSPFVDDDKFLRVGGRISQADLPYDTKHPLLLPKACHTTLILIKYYHKLYMHVGPRTLHGILSRKYWIINGRNVIRSVLSKCAECFKFRPTSVQPMMGTLPSTRLQPNKIFNHVGVDIGGPFIVKESQKRNAKTYKAYLCLFICFSTKAVHLEVLSDLSCECFLAAFDRFVSRRGLCNCLYSDCGTNFVAASKYLKEVSIFFNNKKNRDDIFNGLTSRFVNWKFNPPSAPSMGGLWEAGIKSAKHHLFRSTGDRVFTFEELSTIFCKIEMIMNSRPLCPMSDNPNEFDVITAGHFLIGQSMLSVPENDLEDVSLSRLSRWQSLQRITQSFWKRWSHDYLHTLQQRAKWFSSPPNLKEGDLVLVKSDVTRPSAWPLARVDKIHPGVDNIVRVVTLRTKNNTFKRPVNKICPLPYAN